MKKDFQRWHNKKSGIDKIEQRPFFHNGEIWWCSLGINIGFEQDGGGDDLLRPVIIFRKFNNEIFWAIPLTHTKKKSKYYFQLSPIESDKISTAILSQIRLIDAKRLSHKSGNLNKDEFATLTKKFKALLP